MQKDGACNIYSTFSVPAQISMNINGTPENFKFEQQADLTRAGYKIPNLVQKKENAHNQFKVKGTLTEKGGLNIKDWVYELSGNKISGSMQIPDLDKRDFTVQFASKEFTAHPSYQILKSWAADGSINFNISGTGNLNQLENSSFGGKIDLINLKVEPKRFSSYLLLNAKLRFKEKRFDIRSASIASSANKLNFSGVYRRGESPNFQLLVEGEKLDINELLSASRDKDASVAELFAQTEIFQRGKGKVIFNIGKLNFKMLHLNNVAGKIFLNNKVFQLKDFRVGINPLVKNSVVLTIDENGVSTFEGRLKVNYVKTKNVFSLFGDVFKNSLSGDIKKINVKLNGKGKGWSEISRSLYGKISLDLRFGMVDRKRLKRGVDKLFGSLPTGSLPSEKNNPTSFRQISGDFISKNGIFETENFIFETKARRTSIVGAFDLGANQMDTVVGVAPLAKLDRFLTKIPLVGKILTAGDEKSLLKNYYTVKGNFETPEILPIPFTSLGKKVMGIFQGVLQAPVEILESLPAIEPPVASSTEDVPSSTEDGE